MIRHQHHTPQKLRGLAAPTALPMRTPDHLIRFLFGNLSLFRYQSPSDHGASLINA
ncbi:hypothetical protein [Ectopseudomonas mendocina]|uniref:hypothetical protein n=1 Tax=Ectopseudomonas mendocina TaxID=300 RepID=UPI0023EA9012|nr:hypothetical protein [Pseudomonas mendocina]